MQKNISTLLDDATRNLLQVSNTARLDAELLLMHVLQVERGYLYINSNKTLSEAEENRFGALLQRRLSGEPIAYILGKREFWSLEFDVNCDVLIPRPETELLVELALRFLDRKDALNVLELGTGSGAIALALAHECPGWSIIATDISAAALEVARHNARKFAVKNVTFAQGEWFVALQSLCDNGQCKKQKFSAIISNPPYVETKACIPVQSKGLEFEPRRALFAGLDGLDALREIIKESPRWLLAGGCLILEHGCEHGKEVRKLMSENGFCDIQCFKDLAGFDRATMGAIGKRNVAVI